jgi:hypothetical protein
MIEVLAFGIWYIFSLVDTMIGGKRILNYFDDESVTHRALVVE